MPLQQICEPLQLFGAGRLSGRLSSGVVPHTPAALQVAAKHFGGAGQLAGVKHWTQMPAALQNGVAVPTQFWHCTPLMPQLSLSLTWQVPTFPGPAEQQPFGQLWAVQTHCPWPLQTVPLGHVMQMLPLKPQLSVVGGEMHGPVSVSQHPFGQLVALQTHCPWAL
jgi:hypothetical protein